jgi:hypothetical protein
LKHSRVSMAAGIVVAALFALMPSFAMADSSFISGFTTVSTVASTVPANGDVNPYGIAVVPVSTGKLVRNDVLISNFNNAPTPTGGNLQGTGTTIVQISPSGTQTLFADISAANLPGPCPGGVGLTTALVVLRSGWVIVGSLPTTDGSAATAGAGCLIVLNSRGTAVETLSGGSINGPWDATALDLGGFAEIFVTNVLNGTVAANGAVVNRGTVVRLLVRMPDGDSGQHGKDGTNGVQQDRGGDGDGDGMPRVVASTVIGSGFAQRTDPAALVVGPTGVGLSRDTLYVADSASNRIVAIPNAAFRTTSAGTGSLVSMNGVLNDPLGLTIAPNGDILTVNGNDGNLVETTPGGSQIAHRMVDASGSPPGSGALFGLTIAPGGHGVYFVDDATNTLNLLH